MEEYDLDQDPQEIAAEEGLTVILPKPNELQLDIDSPELPPFYENHFHILGGFKTILKCETTKSRNGNLHVTITLADDITDLERTLMQALLGSDLKRELLGYRRQVLHVDRPPQCFFEVK